MLEEKNVDNNTCPSIPQTQTYWVEPILPLIGIVPIRLQRKEIAEFAFMQNIQAFSTLFCPFSLGVRDLKLPRNSLKSIMHADDNVAPNWEIGHGGGRLGLGREIQGVINADFYRRRRERGHISHRRHRSNNSRRGLSSLGSN